MNNNNSSFQTPVNTSLNSNNNQNPNIAQGQPDRILRPRSDFERTDVQSYFRSRLVNLQVQTQTPATNPTNTVTNTSNNTPAR